VAGASPPGVVPAAGVLQGPDPVRSPIYLLRRHLHSQGLQYRVRERVAGFLDVRSRKLIRGDQEVSRFVDTGLNTTSHGVGVNP